MTTSTELVAVRQQITERREAGAPSQELNALYQQSLRLAAQSGRAPALPGSTPAVQEAAARLVESRERAAALLDRLEPEDRTLLFDDSAWSGDDGAAASLGLVSALHHDHPEFDALARRWGLSDGAMLALGALVAAKMGYRFEPAGAAAQPQPQGERGGQPNTSPAVLSDREFRAQLKERHAAIDRAKAEHDSREANQLYLETQRWIASVRGNGPIINGRRVA